MNSFTPGTVILGAHPTLDKITNQQLWFRNGRDSKAFPGWQMPKPIRHEPHWMNPKKRAEAEANGLDRMTAGVQYTIMVPIYRGVSTAIFNMMKNRLRRKKKGLYAS